MNISTSIPLLMTLGISEESSHLLLTLMTSGPSTVSSLSKKHSLSRTTVYLYLSELTKKNLCAKRKGEKKYEALAPQSMKARIEEALHDAKENFDVIMKKVLSKEEAPEVMVSEEKEAISHVFKDIALTLPKGGTYYRYTSRKEDFKRDPVYATERTRKELERLVITSAEKASNKRHDPNRFIKTVPREFAFDDNVSLVIYGDKIAHLDHKTGTAITITSKTIARFQEKIFKLLWKRL